MSLMEATPSHLNVRTTLASLPPEWGACDAPRNLTNEISTQINETRPEETVVILDDDPTGTQTVYDLPVLTDWAQSSLDAEFERGAGAFYVLTNSRSDSPEEAEFVNRIVAKRVAKAAKRCGRDLCVISRSDSTLRGHYPLEVDALAETLGGGGWKRF